MRDCRNDAENELFFEGPYPAVLKKIEIVPIENGDSNVMFTFIVFENNDYKEYVHTCKNIFTNGRYDFREYCLSMIRSGLDDEESLQMSIDEADMNHWIGCYYEVDTFDDEFDKTPECYVQESYLYEIDFYGTKEEKEREDCYIYYCKLFEQYESEITAQMKKKIPEELNNYMKETINRTNIKPEREIRLYSDEYFDKYFIIDDEEF